MPRAKKSSNVEQTNLALIVVVLSLILFGLGYIVGRAKTRVKFYDDAFMMKQEIMNDRVTQEEMVESMMEEEESREWMFEMMDDYRQNLRIVR
jgi:hypothetical protein